MWRTHGLKLKCRNLYVVYRYMITRATEINAIVIVLLVVLNNAMMYRAAIEHKLWRTLSLDALESFIYTATRRVCLCTFCCCVWFTNATAEQIFLIQFVYWKPKKKKYKFIGAHVYADDLSSKSTSFTTHICCTFFPPFFSFDLRTTFSFNYCLFVTLLNIPNYVHAMW